MRAIISSGWKDKLPSAALALAVQAAFFALLVFSFAVVTRAPAPEAEVIFLLPRARPAPTEPVVIDARPRRATGSPPAATSILPPGSGAGINTLPPYAQPPSEQALLQSLRNGLDCRPDAQGKPSPLCDPQQPPPDPNAALARKPPPIRNGDYWAWEKARADAPFTLPGGSPLGILLTAITNPGAFLDKRNYSAPIAPPAPLGSYERKEQILRELPPCPPGMGTDFERRACGGNVRGAVKY